MYVVFLEEFFFYKTQTEEASSTFRFLCQLDVKCVDMTILHVSCWLLLRPRKWQYKIARRIN